MVRFLNFIHSPQLIEAARLKQNEAKSVGASSHSQASLLATRKVAEPVRARDKGLASFSCVQTWAGRQVSDPGCSKQDAGSSASTGRTTGMEQRAGGAEKPRESRGGRSLPLPASPSARQLLARLDARPLAARAAADVAALVRRAGTTLRLRPKEDVSVLDSADIEVTDSRLPHATVVEHRLQHRQSETLRTCATPSQATQVKPRCASKAPQSSGRFCVELVRDSAGFGFTLSGGRDTAGDAPLAVRGLLKDGPAHRCGRLQAGDLMLYINGESTQGLTHAQVVERIRAGGPRLHLVLHRPLETHPGKTEGIGGPRKGDDCSPDPEGPEVRFRSSSTSPVRHPRSGTTPKTWRSLEASTEAVGNGLAVPPSEHRTDPDSRIPGSPGPWLVPSEERLSRALGVRGAAQLAH
ncbi:PDZ domain-containing protein MAGIX [Tupaia chinensis]|uniref:PDZ domain-containing protein MAGIX n=1 Tax=Tupaia chinensis TaxID=246437 RepID=UPI00070424A3|nr:PDZ domain-containing protein MAGIX [Tupaia chinensis]